ncbi:hypothetical protein [Clostridium peptidivorans]|uniref:hypothetical protein n=1 Tax=Clostridium peptidivorans TaxID=100174 RepID=UPI000BE39EEA|nr:hypothetical protein [Clostridium peptidivorans]
MIKNIFKSNYFSFLVILIFNILLITKKIKFGTESILTICIIFAFFLISGHIINIKSENKSMVLRFVLRIVTVIIFLIIMLGPINIIPDKHSYSSGFIIVTECLMLEIIIYFLSDKIK